MFWTKKDNTAQEALEKRKLLRLEAVKDAFVTVTGSYNIVSNMYTFKAVPMDDRWHSFAVLVEANEHFAFSGHSNTKSIMKLEDDLRNWLTANYRIRLMGLYWHVTESSESFNKTMLKPFENRVPSKHPIRSISQIAATLHESDVTDDFMQTQVTFPPDYDTITMDLTDLK